MRPGPVAIVGVLLGLALIFSACGDDGTAAAGNGTVTKAAGQVGTTAPSGRCRGQLGGFLGTLDGLRSGLAVGLSYDAYLNEVESAKAAYADIPAGRLSIDCLMPVATPGERALNQYVDGVNAWGDCLAAVSCDLGPLEPRLRRMWERASDYLSAAQGELRGLRFR
jgi:hypothetical protein